MVPILLRISRAYIKTEIMKKYNYKPNIHLSPSELSMIVYLIDFYIYNRDKAGDSNEYFTNKGLKAFARGCCKLKEKHYKNIGWTWSHVWNNYYDKAFKRIIKNNKKLKL